MNLRFTILLFLFISCDQKTEAPRDVQITYPSKTNNNININPKIAVPDTLTSLTHSVNKASADTILAFAQTLLGTPYLYASTDPQKGFDCSGFITYVFTHFGINVPRSSRDFEYFGITVPLPETEKGDLILFTGTDSIVKIIGHIGIVISNDSGNVKFIHSSSGKANGVTISSLDKYYQNRFVRVLRIPRAK